MGSFFPLVSRYRLDDEDTWLVGIDPLRRYWLSVNGDKTLPLVVPGLNASCREDFREAILAFREMRPSDSIQLPTAVGMPLTVKCISRNCFLIEANVNGCPASHLFDQESLESLLMTAHPDWRCAPHHKELGRQMLILSWEKPAAVEVA
ncbi:MAG: hypothetical protein F6K42_22005 [Leptolyngbya sp. SIO1D8]|nr:hypothetical protein [Leptolyngbya sp. SIO1D8]